MDLENAVFNHLGIYTQRTLSLSKHVHIEPLTGYSSDDIIEYGRTPEGIGGRDMVFQLSSEIVEEVRSVSSLPTVMVLALALASVSRPESSKN